MQKYRKQEKTTGAITKKALQQSLSGSVGVCMRAVPFCGHGVQHRSSQQLQVISNTSCENYHENIELSKM
jgi:hypothetical protein